MKVEKKEEVKGEEKEKEVKVGEEKLEVKEEGKKKELEKFKEFEWMFMFVSVFYYIFFIRYY